MKQATILAIAFFLVGCHPPQDKVPEPSVEAIVLNTVLNDLVAKDMKQYPKNRRLYILKTSVPDGFTPEIKGVKVSLVNTKDELYAKTLFPYCRVRIERITVAGKNAKVDLRVSLPNFGEAFIYAYTLNVESNQWRITNFFGAG